MIKETDIFIDRIIDPFFKNFGQKNAEISGIFRLYLEDNEVMDYLDKIKFIRMEVVYESILKIDLDILQSLLDVLEIKYPIKIELSFNKDEEEPGINLHIEYETNKIMIEPYGND